MSEVVLNPLQSYKAPPITGPKKDPIANAQLKQAEALSEMIS